MLNKKTMIKNSAPVWVCLFTLCTAHAAVVRTPVPSIKPLLMEALARGEAHGVLAGEAPAIFQQHFGTDAPIEVDVKRVAAHRQPGCARLSVRTRQARVVLPNEAGAAANKPKTMELTYQIDYCDSGEFPQGEEEK